MNGPGAVVHEIEDAADDEDEDAVEREGCGALAGSRLSETRAGSSLDPQRAYDEASGDAVGQGRCSAVPRRRRTSATGAAPAKSAGLGSERRRWRRCGLGLGWRRVLAPVGGGEGQRGRAEPGHADERPRDEAEHRHHVDQADGRKADGQRPGGLKPAGRRRLADHAVAEAHGDAHLADDPGDDHRAQHERHDRDADDRCGEDDRHRADEQQDEQAGQEGGEGPRGDRIRARAHGLHEEQGEHQRCEEDEEDDAPDPAEPGHNRPSEQQAFGDPRHDRAQAVGDRVGADRDVLAARGELGRRVETASDRPPDPGSRRRRVARPRSRRPR